MNKLIEMFFRPPPMPPIQLPLPARVIPGVRVAIAKAFELAYYRGVYDGFVAGVLVALLFVPTIRSRLIKGAANVVDHI